MGGGGREGALFRGCVACYTLFGGGGGEGILSGKILKSARETSLLSRVI